MASGGAATIEGAVVTSELGAAAENETIAPVEAPPAVLLENWFVKRSPKKGHANRKVG